MDGRREDATSALTLGSARGDHTNEHRSHSQKKRLCKKETRRSDQIEYLELPQGQPPCVAADNLENVGSTEADELYSQRK